MAEEEDEGDQAGIEAGDSGENPAGGESVLEGVFVAARGAAAALKVGRGG